jgi:hypothetical protein
MLIVYSELVKLAYLSRQIGRSSRTTTVALTLKIKQSPELLSTGIVEVDVMLGGGMASRGAASQKSAARLLPERLLLLCPP